MGDTRSIRVQDLGFSQNWVYYLGDPYIKGYIILGSILGPPHFGKVPYSYELYSKLLKGGSMDNCIGDYYRAY